MIKNQGYIFELIASIILTLKGYKILERNYSSHFGEIDIIAKKSNIIVVVEVKKRQSIDTAKYSIGYNQKNRIRNSISFYIRCHQKYEHCLIRFDAFVFAPKSLPKHIKNAWY